MSDYALRRVVLYAKSHSTVSPEERHNMSTKNREILFVALKAVHLKGALEPHLDSPHFPDTSVYPVLSRSA